MRIMMTLFMAATPAPGRQLHINADSAFCALCEASHKAQWHNLKKVKLQDIAVRGNPGDFVLLVGGTW
jgi:hypothetical protein